MSNELRVEDGYQHFVSPKRKRMMSPNNCIKISKDQGGGSTHVQKHRDVDFHDSDGDFAGDILGRPCFVDNQLASSTSGSPSTNCFIRKPISDYNRREDRNDKKFGSLKKGNLFSEGDGNGCYSSDDDFDGDVDADDKFERRIRENQESGQGLALKKSFTFGRNFGDSGREGANQHDTDHELLETDAGTESDYSGVAGKMSALSVGKRTSGFSFPAKRSSPGSSPASSQNSSVNSSFAQSPALVMDDLLSAETGGSSPRRSRSQHQQQQRLQSDLKGRSLFDKEEMPSRTVRSRATRLISSAILNSNSSANSFAAQTPLHAHDATAPHGSSSSSSSSSSANNTHINSYHPSSSGLANRSHSHSDHTDVLFDTSDSSQADLLLLSRDHSMASGVSGDSFVNRHRSLEYPAPNSQDEADKYGDELFHSDWGQERHHGTSLPPRTPFAHKTGHHHHQLHTHETHHQHGAAGSALPRIDETRTRRAASAASAADGEEGEDDDGPDSTGNAATAAMRYDLNGSPIVTPSRGRRRRGEGSHSHPHSHSASMSMSLSQQSHEAAMGDLGTPVTEVGSPAVLEGMDDLVGEEDSCDEEEEQEGDAGGGARRILRSEDSMDDSPSRNSRPRARLNSSLLLPGEDESRGERDDPELVMITTMRGSDSLSHVKGRDRRHPRRKISSPTTGGGSTAGPKSRLFADDRFHDDEEQQDQDHQYHLFAQQFMVSPTADMGGGDDDSDNNDEGEGEDLGEYGRDSSPLFHKSRQTSRDGGVVVGGGGQRSSRAGEQLLDSSNDLSASDASSSSMSMSLTRTHSGLLSLNRTNPLNLTRTGSDTLMLSRSSRNSSHNSSSNCMDTSAITGTSSAFLPLPDQSAFDGPAHADLSRSSYELSSSYASIDPLFPTPGSARKKRPVQAMGSPSGAGGSVVKAAPPTPLRGLDWGLLGPVSPSAERRPHHAPRNLKQEAQDQLNATSSSSSSFSRSSFDSTPHHATQGIAMPGSEDSARSAGSHDSDILVHHRHQHRRVNSNSNSIFDASGSGETKEASLRYGGGARDRDMDVSSPSDSFASLSARPALVRQSSLLDTKLLLSQAEDGTNRREGMDAGVNDNSAAAVVSFRSDFEEVGLLGSGTFADVYKVRQVTPGSDPSRHFAVKKSKRQFKSKRDREWLMQEVRTMKLVGGGGGACAFVVPFIRAWQEDSYFYVQMGFAERGTLRELLLHLAAPAATTRRNSNNNNSNTSNNTSISGSSSTNNSAAVNGALVPDNTLWHVVHDVTAGLRHIHACGMVHLDIKPANLLITEGGTLQIGDFGMAASIGSSEDGHEGDTRYMAEELLNNPPRHPSADIFSLGITLYEVACFCSEESAAATSTGRDSFPLRITPRLGLPTEGALWHTLRENRAPPIPAHRSHVLQQLLAATMQRAPAARPSTEQILSLADVAAAEDDVDTVLLCAPKHSDVRRAGAGSSMPPYIARSASVQEILAGGGRAGLSLGLSVAVGDNNEIDYAALGDGAFTPNFAHSSYSPH